MHAFVGANETALQKLNGIIADLPEDFTNVGTSAPGGGGTGDIFFSLVWTLADTKTLACGKNYRSFSAENPYKRKNYPAEQRAALVPKQYLSKARSSRAAVASRRRGQRPGHHDQVIATHNERRRGQRPGHHGQVPVTHNERSRG